MKTVDQFRSTESFCIIGEHFKYMERIVKYFAPAHVHAFSHVKGETAVYTVRVSYEDGPGNWKLKDYKVNAAFSNDIRVIESEQIL